MYGLWYDRAEIPLIGLRTAGVKAINLKDDGNKITVDVFFKVFENITDYKEVAPISLQESPE